MKKDKKGRVDLSEENLSNVSGGVMTKGMAKVCGGPIYANCAKCGKRFQAGNGGVNHAVYPLATVCPKCAQKAK